MRELIERTFTPKARAEPHWQHYASDSALALAGVTLITGVLALAHLYPRIPTIVFVYLLLVLALASTRGLYAAILSRCSPFSALISSFSRRHIPFSLLKPKTCSHWWFSWRRQLSPANWPRPYVSALSRPAVGSESYASSTNRRKNSCHCRNDSGLARELHDSVSQALYGIGLGAYTAREALESDPEQAGIA